MKRWQLFAFSLLAWGLLCAAQPAAAQTVLISTLNNTDVHGDGVDSTGVWIAQSFTTDAATHTLHSVDAALTMYDGGLPSNITARLFSASSGDIGSALATLGPASSQGGDVYRFSTGSTQNLTASTKYWIVLSMGGTGGAFWRYGDSTAETGPGSLPATKTMAYSMTSGSSWNYINMSTTFTPYRFQVNVDGPSPTAVPEPGALALFLPALGAVAILRRRRA